MGYDGTSNLLNVTVQDGSAAVQNIISNYSINLASTLGTGSAFVGFTGGTGSGYEEHDILNWAFTSTTPAPPPVATSSSVPEPATLALLGAGMAALGLARRRTRR